MNEKVSIDRYGVLLCGHCGENYLHHGAVTVYHRAEDEARTYETHIKGNFAACAVVPSAESLNPSLRRAGVAIRFECENCDNISELTIAQHKGQTFLKWRQ